MSELCSLYKPSVREDGRVVVVPTLERASVWRIVCWVREGNAPGQAERYVREVREAQSAGDEEAKTLAKSMLWSFTPSGVVADGSKRTKVGIRWESRTRLVAIDIDHATEAERLRDEMAMLPHTVAAWVSASGAGVKTLILVDDVGTTAEEFHAAWFAAQAHVAAAGYPPAHGTKIDVPGSYWNGIQFLSHDPGAFYSECPVPLCVADYPEPEKRPTAASGLRSIRGAYSTSFAAPGKPSEAQVVDMLNYVNPPDLHWMDGQITVLKMADALADWGGSAAEGLFRLWLVRVGYDRHDPKDAWKRAMEPGKARRVTFGSLAFWAKEGGWRAGGLRRLPRVWRPAKPEDPEAWMH